MCNLLFTMYIYKKINIWKPSQYEIDQIIQNEEIWHTGIFAVDTYKENHSGNDFESTKRSYRSKM